VALEARTVLRQLAVRFGQPNKPQLDPLDEFVLTVLSQSTTDANRDRAWETLLEHFPNPNKQAEVQVAWEEVRQLGREKLENFIRVAGLAGQKAGTIHAALDRLAAEVGELTLDHLNSMDDKEAIDYLTSFKGVGVKTASCVLCFSLHRPVLPVDTHVFRIARRLGWIPLKATADKAHALLADRVDPADRFLMHMLLITHGRNVCLARSPKCAECPLAETCPRISVLASGAN
jgi:endonuclease-3